VQITINNDISIFVVACLSRRFLGVPDNFGLSEPLPFFNFVTPTLRVAA
jgi:hypothetical protein